MAHCGRTVLAINCVLAGAEMHRGRPLNSVYKDFPDLFNVLIDTFALSVLLFASFDETRSDC